MKLTIDRFEGEIAVCEDSNKKMCNISKTDLPINVKEGDVIVSNGDIFIIDVNETKRRKKEIKELFDSLLE